mmetsp:Transcript_36900/g.106445  ORF Transcript_36900/g.106445 Transcript_36900/m.106445 type:complete len:274 (-) Transcript_36900:16-837(-)
MLKITKMESRSKVGPNSAAPSAEPQEVVCGATGRASQMAALRIAGPDEENVRRHEANHQEPQRHRDDHVEQHSLVRHEARGVCQHRISASAGSDDFDERVAFSADGHLCSSCCDSRSKVERKIPPGAEEHLQLTAEEKYRHHVEEKVRPVCVHEGAQWQCLYMLPSLNAVIAGHEMALEKCFRRQPRCTRRGGGRGLRPRSRPECLRPPRLRRLRCRHVQAPDADIRPDDGVRPRRPLPRPEDLPTLACAADPAARRHGAASAVRLGCLRPES